MNCIYISEIWSNGWLNKWKPIVENNQQQQSTQIWKSFYSFEILLHRNSPKLNCIIRWCVRFYFFLPIYHIPCTNKINGQLFLNAGKATAEKMLAMHHANSTVNVKLTYFFLSRNFNEQNKRVNWIILGEAATLYFTLSVGMPNYLTSALLMQHITE